MEIETVFFGRYFQNNDAPEPIEWYVIAVDTNRQRKLLLSKHGLDCIPYDLNGIVDIWKECSLRSWLNNDFFRVAFSYTEQERIVPCENLSMDPEAYDDKVFCLSEDEFLNYLNSDSIKMALSTKLTSTMSTGTACGHWWLRLDRHIDKSGVPVFSLDSISSGRIEKEYISPANEIFAVRPSIWVKMDDSV